MNLQKRDLLIVFIKNPLLGKVKTRLANTVGDEKALTVYTILLRHTLEITKQLFCDKIVCYSDFVPPLDDWSSAGFSQALQWNGDLGERMKNAFVEGFKKRYDRIVIIGSDCYELQTATIVEAFQSLQESEVVIGPAHDGGYYLLGMTKLFDELFKEKQWSTSSVLPDTLKNLNTLDVSYKLLRTLSDIDNEADLKVSEITIM